MENRFQFDFRWIRFPPGGFPVFSICFVTDPMGKSCWWIPCFPPNGVQRPQRHNLTPCPTEVPDRRQPHLGRAAELRCRLSDAQCGARRDVLRGLEWDAVKGEVPAARCNSPWGVAQLTVPIHKLEDPSSPELAHADGSGRHRWFIFVRTLSSVQSTVCMSL